MSGTGHNNDNDYKTKITTHALLSDTITTMTAKQKQQQEQEK